MLHSTLSAALFTKLNKCQAPAYTTVTMYFVALNLCGLCFNGSFAKDQYTKVGSAILDKDFVRHYLRFILREKMPPRYRTQLRLHVVNNQGCTIKESTSCTGSGNFTDSLEALVRLNIV